MIDYGKSSFLEECEKAFDSGATFAIRVAKPDRKAAAIRRQLRLLEGAKDPYPLLLNAIDKVRLSVLWAGMSHAIAAGWRFAYYEDERGFEIYLTPRP